MDQAALDHGVFLSSNTWILQHPKKALQVAGVNRVTTELNISSIHQRHRVTVATIFYKIHTSICPSDLYALLPQLYLVSRPTLSMTCNTLSILVSITVSKQARLSSTLQLIFGTSCHTECIVGDIFENDIVRFKSNCHVFEPSDSTR